MSSSKQLGKWGEALAASYFQNEGYNILAQNFCIRGGELDLVAQKSGLLLIVEVKTRKNKWFQHPLESITPQKMRRLKKAAITYFERHPPQNVDIVRFDLVTILGTPQTGHSLEHYRDIFDFLSIEPEV